MPITTVGVLGCGLMGSGIAQVCAGSGYKTIVLDASTALLEKGLGRIRKTLEDGITRGKVTTAQRDATLGHLTGATDVQTLAACDVVIEAIVERIDEKRRMYTELAAALPPHTIVASNTSSMCITELAAATDRPDRFAGLHFFNPVPLMKLVEVIRGLTTSDDTYQTVFDFAKSLGKEAISAPDRPGFIVNRLLVPYLLDAIRAQENGLGTVEDIDAGMQLGCGYPMGPFRLLDLVGLDTVYDIANSMYTEFREPAYAPPPLLKRMVKAGYFGKKSGRGFYKY